MTMDLFSDGIVPVVDAAVRTGLWAALTPDPQPAGPLAARCGLDGQAVALVLDALAATGAVTVCDAGFARARLHGGWPFTDTARFLTTGERAMDLSDVAHRAHVYREAVLHLRARFQAEAEFLARQLPTVETILDLGCGSGVWSFAMAERDPRVRVTAVDLAGVAEHVPDWAREAGLAGRVTVVASDVHDLDLDERFDRVILANLLHLEPAERAERMVHRAARHLRDDGELVIVDMLGGTTVEAKLNLAFYALHLGMRTRVGGVHAEAEVRRWCASAGLPNAHLVDPAVESGGRALIARGPDAGSLVHTTPRRREPM